MQEGRGRIGPGAAAIVAALLLPPLGLFLDRGITPAFWIATLLTILFFVPGAIYSLVMLLRRSPTA